MGTKSTHPELKLHVVHVGPVRGHVARVLVRVVDDGVDDVQGDVVHVVDRAVDEGGADAVGAAAAAGDFLVVVGVVGVAPLTAKPATTTTMTSVSTPYM